MPDIDPALRKCFDERLGIPGDGPITADMITAFVDQADALDMKKSACGRRLIKFVDNLRGQS